MRLLSIATLYATATSTALWNIFPFPAASAFASAPLNIFSNIRGTAKTNVGLNVPRSAGNFVISLQCAK